MYCTQFVISVLLKKGRQSFNELLTNCSSAHSNRNSSTQDAAVTRSSLKQVLLVLIQQNCVVTFLQPPEVRVNGVRPAVYLYDADLKHILQITR